jgi:hypothetical protein
MKRITFLTKITAIAAVVALAGSAFAQPTAPSLVTQQLRLSDGAGNYVSMRAGTGGAGSDATHYLLDAAPATSLADGYALWLDNNNHIRTSIKFNTTPGNTAGIGSPGYLYRVNAAGTGTEWVVPTDLTTANNGLVVDNTTTPGTTIVQLGALATATNTIAVPRFVSQAAGGSLTFDGAGALSFGAGAATMNVTIDPGAAGFLKMNNLPTVTPPAATDKFVYLDGTTNIASTRLLSSLVNADNGLVIDLTATPGAATVQLGALASGTNTITASRFVTQAQAGAGALTFDGTGALAFGAGTAKMDVTIDPSATGSLFLKNLPTSALATDLIVLIDATTNAAKTRAINSLVDANNGLFLDITTSSTPTVQLGGIASGVNTIAIPRFVTQAAGGSLTFDGLGALNLGGGTATMNITVDPGAAGVVKANNIPAQAVGLATDQFMMIDPTTANQVKTRLLSSLVSANEGLVVDNTTTPGTSIIQLGSTTDGTNPIDNARFVTLTGAAPSLTFDGTGAINIGTAGNLALNVDTKASDMTLKGTNLAAATGAAFHNIVYVDETTNAVHTITAANMVRNDAPTDYVAIDPATGNIVKSISPTAGIYRGHTAWTGWTQTITLGATQTINAGASVTCTIENHASAGTIGIQVTGVTTGAAGSFTIETTDVPTTGSFINWVVINP